MSTCFNQTSPTEYFPFHFKDVDKEFKNYIFELCRDLSAYGSIRDLLKKHHGRSIQTIYRAFFRDFSRLNRLHIY